MRLGYTENLRPFLSALQGGFSSRDFSKTSLEQFQVYHKIKTVLLLF